jgi:hypothetical protein
MGYQDRIDEYLDLVAQEVSLENTSSTSRVAAGLGAVLLH